MKAPALDPEEPRRTGAPCSRDPEAKRQPRALGSKAFESPAGRGPEVATLATALCEVDLNRQHMPGKAEQLRTPKARAVSLGFERFQEWKAKQARRLSGGGASTSSCSSSPLTLGDADSPWPQAALGSPGLSQGPGSAPRASGGTPGASPSSELREEEEAGSAAAEGEQPTRGDLGVSQKAERASVREMAARWEGFEVDDDDDDDDSSSHHASVHSKRPSPGICAARPYREASSNAVAGLSVTGRHTAGAVASVPEGAPGEAAGDGDRSEAVKWTINLPVWPITLEVAVGVRRTISDPSDMPPRIPDPEAPPLKAPTSQLLRGQAEPVSLRADEEAPPLKDALQPPPFEVALSAAAARLSHWSSTGP